MMSVTEVGTWVNRLKALCPSFAERVFLTIPDPHLAIDQHLSPVAFVYVEQEQSENNKIITGFRQVLTATIAVEIVIRRTATSADPYSENDTLILNECRNEVFAALIGWLPSDDANPVAHELGQLSQKNEQVIKFIDKFTASRVNRLDF